MCIRLHAYTAPCIYSAMRIRCRAYMVPRIYGAARIRRRGSEGERTSHLVKVSLLDIVCSVFFLRFQRDGKKIEFRDANNLRMILLTYKPPVRPGCLAVTPPSLLFYEEMGKPGRYVPRECSGEVRTLDCSTNPPRPGTFKTFFGLQRLKDWGGGGGKRVPLLGPISFNFMQSWGGNGQMNSLVPPPWGWLSSI